MKKILACMVVGVSLLTMSCGRTIIPHAVMYNEREVNGANVSLLTSAWPKMGKNFDPYLNERPLGTVRIVLVDGKPLPRYGRFRTETALVISGFHTVGIDLDVYEPRSIVQGGGATHITSKQTLFVQVDTKPGRCYEAAFDYLDNQRSWKPKMVDVTEARGGEYFWQREK